VRFPTSSASTASSVSATAYRTAAIGSAARTWSSASANGFPVRFHACAAAIDGRNGETPQLEIRFIDARRPITLMRSFAGPADSRRWMLFTP
jgi:hypothetical protein